MSRLPVARLLLYVATAGALSLVGRTLIIGPVPMAVAVTAFAAYVALIGCGVGILRLGMFVDVVWRGPRGARGVALTFDDGPSPEHTPRILDLLDEGGAKATFFVIGRKAAAHPELVREIAARGHGIGVHGYDHDRFLSLRAPDVVGDDLAEAIATVETITGTRPALYRPPVGLTSPRIAQALSWFDVTVVGWSVRAFDGVARAKPASVVARVVPRLRDGAIVLLHDSAERDDHTPASVAALPRILAAMRARDLEGVCLDRWIVGDVGDAGDAGNLAPTSSPRAPAARPS